ncbi:hypothetical protein [Kordiimonas sp.]|uniref:hypothetical protein n=1 Tax=Kordiimonas sp. TaxID=1970157 RepID=UPI003A909C85
MQDVSGLRILQLVLVGYRKNYIVPFTPGVNIIYGDADTGKSSILRIIHYMLGGKELQLDHEITSSVQYAAMEAHINGKPYCIRRDLFNSKRDVEVFECAYDEIDEHFPKKFAPSLVQGDDQKTSLSEFLLDELNFPSVELKQSPSKDDSARARLSIRDLLKYCYLNQDAVGSRRLLDIGNYAVRVKNQEVFKYIFNLLDSQISDLQAKISEKAQEKKNLEQRLGIIGEFLSEVEYETASDIENALKQLDEQAEFQLEQLSDVNKRITSNSAEYDGFKDALDTINLKIKEYQQKSEDASRSIERFSRLKNDYLNDISKLQAIIQSEQMIGKEDLEKVSSCPICDSKLELQLVSESFSITPEDKALQEINSLRRRMRDLDHLVSDNRHHLAEYSGYLKDLRTEQETAKRYLDEELASSISPYLTQRDALVGDIAALKEKRASYTHDLKTVNQFSSLRERISKLESDVELLKKQLEELEKNGPSLDDIVGQLSDSLDAYLEKIHIKNKTNISIDPKSFLPVVRGVEYPNINSGGLRTIISIGYLAIIMRMALDQDINLPGILMIDTVGKYLGKTKDTYQDETDASEDSKEDISDPNKYKNIYEYLIDLSDDFEDSGKNCQILLVDNDVPAEISEKYKGFVVAHYSSEGANGLPVGLIDDWDEFINKKSN